MDAVGSHIRIDSRGASVLRVLPRIHEDINEEWISDKTRHACDGLRVQRLDRPYIRGRDGKLAEATWEQAFTAIARRMSILPPQEMAALAGNLACAESVMALRDVLDSMGIANRDCRQEGAVLEAGERTSYLFNTTIAGIEQADVCLMIGANPRREASLVNARLRKAWRSGKLAITHLGNADDLTYPYHYLGNDPRILARIADGSHEMAQLLAAAKKPMLILGTAALARRDSVDILAAVRAITERCGLIKDGWNGFNILHHAAGRVGALDLGFVPGKEGRNIQKIFDGCRRDEVKLVYLLGADEFDMELLGKAFVIYQGHHGDDAAHRADVILPGAAYSEKDATYVNLEGRVQRTSRAVFPPGEAKEDWAILRALSDALGKKLPYNNLEQLRARMEKIAPHFAQVGEVVPAPWPVAVKTLDKISISDIPFDEFITNFYMTDPISRASKTMAECTKAIGGQLVKKVA